MGSHLSRVGNRAGCWCVQLAPNARPAELKLAVHSHVAQRGVEHIAVSKMAELEGRVALVTGAGRLRGIGRATAVALAKLGADVIVTGTGRDPDTFPDDEKAIGWRDVESTAEQIRELGRRATTAVFDVTDENSVRSAIDQAAQEMGRIDILINNAAVGRGQDRVPVEELPRKCSSVFSTLKSEAHFFAPRRCLDISTRRSRVERSSMCRPSLARKAQPIRSRTMPLTSRS